jgi:hypothetical protein
VNISDVAPAYQEYFDNAEKISPTGRLHIVWDWMPNAKETYATTTLETKCLKGIRSSFSYTAKRVSAKRVTLRGVGENYFKLTGIDMVNNKISGNQELGARFTPKIAMPAAPAPAPAPAPADAAVPAEEAADEAPLAPLAAELLRDTIEFQGWRTSYGKLESDAEQSRKFYNYLALQMKHLASAVDKRFEPTKRRLSAEELKESDDKRTARGNQKLKTANAYYKRLRTEPVAA